MPRHCRSNSARSTGQRRVELRVDTLVSSGTVSFGVAEPSVDLKYDTPRGITVGNLPGSGKQIGLSSSGSVYSKVPGAFSEQSVAAVGAVNEGDVLAMDLDFTGGTASFSINGESVYTSILPTGSYHVVVGVSPGCEATVNLAQNIAMTGPLPAGYTDWDGNALGGTVPVSTTLTYEVV